MSGADSRGDRTAGRPGPGGGAAAVGRRGLAALSQRGEAAR